MHIMSAKKMISIISSCFVSAPGRIVLGRIAWITLHRTARACVASSMPQRQCASPRRTGCRTVELTPKGASVARSSGTVTKKPYTPYIV